MTEQARNGVMNGDLNGNANFIANPLLSDMEHDYMYHLNLGTTTHDLKDMFSDVKFVCMGGTASRMKKLAMYFSEELSLPIKDGVELPNLTGSHDRYVIYKVGPILTASHGVGVPSLSIVLNELFKLLYHAGAKDVEFFRLGTCGGLDLPPGSVVVTTEALNGELQPVYEQFVLGKKVTRPTRLDDDLINALRACRELDDSFDVVAAKTMCANDFYEGQGRTDGAICDYSEEEKFEFLKRLCQAGVRNIEMESIGFAALTKRVNVKSAVVCVTLLNRMINDQIKADSATLKAYESRPGMIVARYFKKKLEAAE